MRGFSEKIWEKKKNFGAQRIISRCIFFFCKVNRSITWRLHHPLTRFLHLPPTNFGNIFQRISSLGELMATAVIFLHKTVVLESAQPQGSTDKI